MMHDFIGIPLGNEHQDESGTRVVCRRCGCLRSGFWEAHTYSPGGRGRSDWTTKGPPCLDPNEVVHEA